MLYSGAHGQSIPPEILSQIFLECLSGNCFPPPAKSEAPLLLGRVCGYWRSVSLSIRKLWTGIGLGGRFPSAINLKKDAMSVEQWRIRAGPSSGLSYSLRYCEWGDNNDSWKELMEAIIPQHQLWRRIQGLLPPSITDQILSVIASHGTPVLGYLNIEINDGFEHLIDISTMPRLQKLVLNLHELYILFNCGSHSLREVVIQGGCYPLTLGNCWIFIIRCPKLEVFQAHCNGRDLYLLGLYPDADIHRHTRLAYLDLRVSENPGFFLDKIEAPNLKSMMLKRYSGRFDGVDAGQGWPHLSSFLNRSKCQLEHLVIGVHRMFEGDIVNCFRASPSLKSFCLETCPSATNAMITALKSDSLNSGEYILCPELERFAFTAPCVAHRRPWRI